MKTPIYTGILQNDLDFAGYSPVNLPGWPPTGGGGSGLDANTVIATDVGLVGDGVTDNTTALQAWIDSVAAAGINSTLLVPDGVYIFSGALQDGSRRNAQILLPSVGITTPTYSITIKGYHPISYIPWPFVSMPQPKGAIFRSTLAVGSGTQPAFIGGMGPSAGDGLGGGVDLSFVAVCFENMIFQTVQNPQITCLKLSHFSVVTLRGEVLIIAGTHTGSTDAIQPTTTTSYGLIFPPDSRGILQQAQNVNVWNFYTGVKMGELTHVANMTCAMCVYALEFGFAYHITLIDRLVDWWCKNGTRMTGAHTFQIKQYDVERGGAGQWYTRVYDIDDGSNQATADITWWTVTTAIGAQDLFTLNGGANVVASRAGRPQAQTFYIGTDARLVTVTGGMKIQARNPGTNTWVDADQWTNP